MFLLPHLLLFPKITISGVLVFKLKENMSFVTIINKIV